MAGQQTKVLVTGATGFVATELVRQLLERGYAVVGTVRDVDSSRTATLRALGERGPGSLELAQADLTAPGAFDEHVRGCTYVFHTASPFVIESDDPQRKIIDLAVDGTRNLLGAVAAAKQDVRRVVLTSSVAAVHGEYGAPPKNGSLYTEDDWNETSTIEQGQAYHRSKALAERAAWELAQQHGLDLVTICPNFVLGPILSPEADSLSVGHIKGLLKGGKIEGSPIICDVRDVAAAHILAATTPSASGRYIVSNRGPVTPELVSATLRRACPGRSIQAAAPAAAAAAAAQERIDSSRAERELGLRHRPAEATLADMAQSAVQLGLV